MSHTPSHERARVFLRPLLGLMAALLLAPGAALARPPTGTGGPDLCAESERPRVRDYNSATRRDAEFNRLFCHGFKTVDGIQLHYVRGGSGPALVLLHGWPQSWYDWRDIMDELAADRTVLAVDLPGLGDSFGEPANYEKRTLAALVRKLVKSLVPDAAVDIASHDLGSGVGWAYALQFPSEVRRLAVMDFPLPGPACSTAFISSLSYHFTLFREPGGVAELLVDDEVRDYLVKFYPHVSNKPNPIPEKDIDEYARTYERPAVLRGGFELYRTLDEDEAYNTRAAPTATLPPVHLLMQDGAFDFVAPCYRFAGATRLTGRSIPGAGHWLVEEAPEQVLSELRAFFGAP